VKNKEIYTITNEKNDQLFKVTDEIFELEVSNPRVKISPIFKQKYQNKDA